MPSLAAPERVTAARKIAQAALLAGSLAGASACTGGSDDKVDASQQARDDAGLADAGPTVDADTTLPDGMPQMPYGAPPARRRLV
jgi:hypothetical protein